MAYPSLLYESPSGYRVDFNDGATVMIRGGIEGLGITQVDYQAQVTPNVHGETLRTMRLTARTIRVPVYIATESWSALLNHSLEMNRILNPVPSSPDDEVQLGLLTYQGSPHGQVYEIEATLIGPFGRDRRRVRWQERTLQFYCPSPFFRRIPAARGAIVVSEGGLVIPWSFPTSIPQTSGTVSIHNAGQVISPVQITATGPFTNLLITNETSGESMRINTTIDADQTFVIDGLEKRVTLDGEQAAKYVGGGSSFVDARIGSNTYAIEADSGSPEVTIECAPLFVGIE